MPNANDNISASQLASHIFSGIWATPSCCQVSSTTATQSPAEVHPIPHVLPLIMESHNAALYGPYQPCPIVARDFTADDVTQLKTKLAEFVTYVHIHISLCLFHFNDLFVFSYVLCECLSARISLPGRHRSVRLSSFALIKFAITHSAVEAHPQITNDPAKRAPRSLYFTWDFLRRTEHNLLQVNVPALVANDEVALEAYNDVLGRVALSCTIITDETGETCRIITQNEPVDFGVEVREKARALQEPAA